jgi:hypothetical protein
MPQSPFALRTCPECTGANDFLEWTASVVEPAENAVFGMRLWQPPPIVKHTYRCRRCGYQCEWRSRSANPDKRTDP